jgi:hypothetical protein
VSGCPGFVTGTFISYPCELPLNHDGPHVAKEVGASVNARRAWEQEYQGGEMQTTTAVDGIVPEKVSTLPINSLNDPAVRVQSMLAKMQDISTMPSWARSYMLGQFAQASLGTLYHLAKAEFQGGAKAVMITPEFLERMLTPPLIELFEAIVREERTAS